MGDETIAARLTPAELKLVRALREVPQSPLLDRTWDLMHELIAFVRQPACPEMQADGVPCATPHTACDQCAQVAGIIDHLRRGLRSRARA